MPASSDKLPDGNFYFNEKVVRNSRDLGSITREQRKRQGMIQLDIAGMANTGNRFIVELEQGKPTVQLQKVLDVLDLLGLELVVRAKARGAA